MGQKKASKPSRRPNFHYTTVKVCGHLVSKTYNLICGLPPHIPHTLHAAVTIGTDNEPYLVIHDQKVPNKALIQLDDGRWLDVEAPKE